MGEGSEAALKKCVYEANTEGCTELEGYLALRMEQAVSSNDSKI
jgi:hypothetical protein